MSTNRSGLLQMIPKVDELLKDPALDRDTSRYSRAFVTHALRVVLDLIRKEILDGRITPETKEALKASIIERIGSAIQNALSSPLVPLINATGVVVHTNLGRSPYPDAALDAMRVIARGYSNLEFDLETGRRGNRDEVVEKVLSHLFPDTSAIVVNNNAAAVLLVLNSLADGKEVLVSRGQLVEIGGSFRIPDVMDKSGAIIHEVGTTNKTHLEDFEKAINERTGMILVVHPSNFKVVGFSSDVDHEKLIALGREKSIPVVEDMGSGNFIDLKPFGVDDEPTVEDHLKLGFDLVTFSGDKLLGGPQAGFIIGRDDLIAGIRKNHLLRPLRLCKTMYAAVAAVLLEYLKGTAAAAIPVLKMIQTPYQALDERSRTFADRLNALGAFDVTVEKDSFKIGGGAAPVEEIPTPVLVANPRDRTVDACLKHLRDHRPPVIARAKEDRLIIDLRTVFPHQEEDVFAAFQSMTDL